MMLEFLSADDIARLCGLSREQAESLIYSGELQFLEVMPGERRVLASSLVEYLNRQAMKTGHGATLSDADLTAALARALEEDEALRSQLASMNPKADTFAEMLKNAAMQSHGECNSDASNVVTFPCSHARQ